MGARESVETENLTDPPIRSEGLVRAIRMLAVQIQVSLEDTDAPYNELAALFSKMAQIEPGKAPADHENDHNTERERLYGQAVMAFQFYDRMCQRLTAVQDGLACLAQHLEDRTEHQVSAEQLLVEHQALYSSPQIEELRSVMRGQPLEDNKEKQRLQEKPVAAQSSIELF